MFLGENDTLHIGGGLNSDLDDLRENLGYAERMLQKVRGEKEVVEREKRE